MQQTVTLFQHSLDSAHASLLACLKAGSGISELMQNQLRTLVEYAQRNTDIDHHTSPLELTRRLFDDEMHIAARDTCVLATGQLIEAHATMLDAAKSVIDCSHAWLIGRVAEAYPRAPHAEASDATELAADEDSAGQASRSRRKNAA